MSQFELSESESFSLFISYNDNKYLINTFIEISLSVYIKLQGLPLV